MLQPRQLVQAPQPVAYPFSFFLRRKLYGSLLSLTKAEVVDDFKNWFEPFIREWNVGTYVDSDMDSINGQAYQNQYDSSRLLSPRQFLFTPFGFNFFYNDPRYRKKSSEQYREDKERIYDIAKRTFELKELSIQLFANKHDPLLLYNQHRQLKDILGENDRLALREKWVNIFRDFSLINCGKLAKCYTLFNFLVSLEETLELFPRSSSSFDAPSSAALLSSDFDSRFEVSQFHPMNVPEPLQNSHYLSSIKRRNPTIRKGPKFSLFACLDCPDYPYRSQVLEVTQYQFLTLCSMANLSDLYLVLKKHLNIKLVSQAEFGGVFRLVPFPHDSLIWTKCIYWRVLSVLYHPEIRPYSATEQLPDYFKMLELLIATPDFQAAADGEMIAFLLYFLLRRQPTDYPLLAKFLRFGFQNFTPTRSFYLVTLHWLKSQFSSVSFLEWFVTTAHRKFIYLRDYPFILVASIQYGMSIRDYALVRILYNSISSFGVNCQEVPNGVDVDGRDLPLNPLDMASTTIAYNLFCHGLSPEGISMSLELTKLLSAILDKPLGASIGVPIHIYCVASILGGSQAVASKALRHIDKSDLANVAHDLSVAMIRLYTLSISNDSNVRAALRLQIVNQLMHTFGLFDAKHEAYSRKYPLSIICQWDKTLSMLLAVVCHYKVPVENIIDPLLRYCIKKSKTLMIPTLYSLCRKSVTFCEDPVSLLDFCDGGELPFSIVDHEFSLYTSIKPKPSEASVARRDDKKFNPMSRNNMKFINYPQQIQMKFPPNLSQLSILLDKSFFISFNVIEHLLQTQNWYFAGEAMSIFLLTGKTIPRGQEHQYSVLQRLFRAFSKYDNFLKEHRDLPSIIDPIEVIFPKLLQLIRTHPTQSLLIRSLGDFRDAEDVTTSFHKFLSINKLRRLKDLIASTTLKAPDTFGTLKPCEVLFPEDKMQASWSAFPLKNPQLWHTLLCQAIIPPNKLLLLLFND